MEGSYSRAIVLCVVIGSYREFSGGGASCLYIMTGIACFSSAFFFTSTLVLRKNRKPDILQNNVFQLSCVPGQELDYKLHKDRALKLDSKGKPV